MKTIRLSFEFILLFLIAPALLYLWTPRLVLPVLWVAAVCCGMVLLRDPGFDRTRLWNPSALKTGLFPMLIQFILFALLLFLLVLFLAPDLLFSLVKQKFGLWVLIILLYPILSVYPQELIYRTFFFHRYRNLFPGRWLFLTMNALMFGYMHIIFHNWIAVGLTIAGGGLFALAYERSKSTLLVSILHSLFGCLIFTLGLGQFFYVGTISTISHGLRF